MLEKMAELLDVPLRSDGGFLYTHDALKVRTRGG
jgi:hypothetical protein